MNTSSALPYRKGKIKNITRDCNIFGVYIYTIYSNVKYMYKYKYLSYIVLYGEDKWRGNVMLHTSLQSYIFVTATTVRTCNYTKKTSRKEQ